MSCYDKVILIDSKDAWNWISKGIIFSRYILANALIKINRYIEAISCCDKAI